MSLLFGGLWGVHRRTRWYLAILGLFIASGFITVREVRYMVSSTTTDGVVSGTHTEWRRSGRFGKHEVLVVDYTFTTEAGESRTGKSDAARDDEGRYAAGTPVRVQYIPGAGGSSRLDGTGMQWVMIPFGVLTLAVVGVCVKFVLDYNKEQKLDAERRQRYSTVR